MNHNLLIDIIIKNRGIILGSYVREWIANGSPSDSGWNDIDVFCPKESEYAIYREISKINLDIKLDFRASQSNFFRSKYSANLAFYDGKNFKIRKPHNHKETEYIKLTQNKICLFLNSNHVGRDLSLEEKLIRNGWLVKLN